MISIVFATRNGARTVGRMLEALCALETARDAYEIVAVDNGSTDHTAELLERYATRLPLTVLSWPIPGKNAALNLGIARATGELIVLTDDDVLPASNWLSEFRALAAERPDVSVFGGRVLGEWPSPPPRWILRQVDLEVCFAIHSEDMEEGSARPWLIWGPNMMVRAALFREGFRFNEGIGPAAGEYMMGGETEFVRRLVAAGHRCLSSRRPVVRHQIREEQLSPQWILGRARRYGKWRCLEDALFAPPERRLPLLFGMPPRHLLRAMVEGGLAVATGAWFGSRLSFNRRWRLERELGYLRQFREMAASRASAGGVVHS